MTDDAANTMDAGAIATARAPLGLAAATALVVGTMIGSGVFLLPATLAPWGAASLIGWGLSLAGSLAIAAVLAWLAAGISRSGGPYCYARAGLGDAAGFMTGWSYWVCLWVGNAALAVAFAGSLGAVFPEVVATPLRGAVTAALAIVFCTVVNARGLRDSGRAQVLMTLLKLVPLLLFGLLALPFVHRETYIPFNPSGESTWQIASTVGAMTMWAFLGLETATVPSGSVRDPLRTVPRATMFGVLIAGLATMLVCTVVIGLLPREQLHASAAPLAAAATSLWGSPAGVAVGVIASISVLGALNGLVMSASQVPLAAARDGLFPRAFASVNAEGTPLFGLFFSSALAAVLMLTNYSKSLVGLFTFSALISTASCLLPYAACVLAWFKLQPNVSVLRKAVAAWAFVYSCWAIWGTGKEALLWSLALIAAGVPVYYWSRRNPLVADATS